jgi:hypothetical protein
MTAASEAQGLLHSGRESQPLSCNRILGFCDFHDRPLVVAPDGTAFWFQALSGELRGTAKQRAPHLGRSWSSNAPSLVMVSSAPGMSGVLA